MWLSVTTENYKKVDFVAIKKFNIVMLFYCLAWVFLLN